MAMRPRTKEPVVTMPMMMGVTPPERKGEVQADVAAAGGMVVVVVVIVAAAVLFPPTGGIEGGGVVADMVVAAGLVGRG
jgi:hypothetical protein